MCDLDREQPAPTNPAYVESSAPCSISSPSSFLPVIRVRQFKSTGLSDSCWADSALYGHSWWLPRKFYSAANWEIGPRCCSQFCWSWSECSSLVSDFSARCSRGPITNLRASRFTLSRKSSSPGALSMNIAIVGSGYVGLVSGTCYAESGNEGFCVDIDAN